MPHSERMFFINSLKTHLSGDLTGKRGLEIGSLDSNGTVRVFFSDCDAIGIDVGGGRHVALVCPGEDYGAPAANEQNRAIAAGLRLAFDQLAFAKDVLGLSEPGQISHPGTGMSKKLRKTKAVGAQKTVTAPSQDAAVVAMCEHGFKDDMDAYSAIRDKLRG